MTAELLYSLYLMLKVHLIRCITLIVGVYLALNQKLPRSIAKDLHAGRRGGIRLVMSRKGVKVTEEARYAVNPNDDHLAVTSRWPGFAAAIMLVIGDVIKVDISRYYHYNDLVFMFAFV